MLLYYFPKRKHVDKSDYDGLGLGHLYDTSPHPREVVKGPDGDNGVIVAPVPAGGNSGKFGYYPDRQTWKKCKGFWAGWNNGEKPGPEQLAREKQCHGYPITLNDGNNWTVVIAKIFSTTNERTTHLPEYFSLDDKGEMTTKIMERYADVVEDAKHFWAVTVDKTEKPSEWPKAIQMAARALGVNYRVGVNECLALDLFTHDNVNEVLTALVDGYAYMLHKLKEMEATQKKTGETSE